MFCLQFFVWVLHKSNSCARLIHNVHMMIRCAPTTYDHEFRSHSVSQIYYSLSASLTLQCTYDLGQLFQPTFTIILFPKLELPAYDLTTLIHICIDEICCTVNSNPDFLPMKPLHIQRGPISPANDDTKDGDEI